MSFASALQALAALSVPGVRHNHAVGVLPSHIARASLPVLLVFPAFEDASRREHGEFNFVAPSGTRAQVQYIVTHLLIVAPVGSGINAGGHLATLVSLLDAYADAIKVDPRLGGALVHPLHYRVHIAPVEYGSTRYFAARLWHTWTIET